MKTRRSARAWLPVLGLLTTLLTPACADRTDDQTGQQPAGQQQTSGDTSQTQTPPAGSPNSGIEWTTPTAWVVEQPSSQMRKAQYRVPGPEGDAEVAVFHFGPGQGGDAMSNATRWASQFTKADGSSSLDEMQTRQTQVNGMPVLFVEVQGTYTNTMVSNEAHPNHRLLGAIVEGPDANWFFKLTGPSATVEGARVDFTGMIENAH